MDEKRFKCELRVTFSGGAIVLTDENCMLYRHIFTPEVDHLYFEAVTGEDAFGEPETQGYYIFSRRDFYAEWERKFGLTLTRAYARDGDVEAYIRHCAEKAETKDLDEEIRHFFQDEGGD